MENPKVDSIQEKEWFESLTFFIYIFQEKKGSSLFLFLIFFNH
jgi:hypothetical protein